MLPSGGPESYIFKNGGDEFYSGVNDGRVEKYAGSDIGVVNVTYSSPFRYIKLMAEMLQPNQH